MLLAFKGYEKDRMIAEVTKIQRFVMGKDVANSSLANLRNSKHCGDHRW
jgi:hypothetical protein